MSNQAAYIASIGAKIEVKASPFTYPGPGEILLRNHAFSINPLDTYQQDYGITVQSFPHIPGMDLAGTIEEVGEGVTRFKKGDRVAASAIFFVTQNPAHAGFQLYTVVPEYTVSRIPDTLDFTKACVLPLCLATAATGLYEPAYMGLDLPTTKESDPEPLKEKAILIWGGSSAVGSCAIQLCVASGLTVLATASSKNHQYIKDLGAQYVFDHAAEDVVKQMIDAAVGKEIVGAYDAISSKETALSCAEFLHANGGGKLFATRPSDFGYEDTLLGDVYRIAGHPPGRTDAGEPAVWMKVWAEFMGQGLETGKLKAKPDPIVIPGGLEKVQDALDLYKQGVSAAKVVVEL